MSLPDLNVAKALGLRPETIDEAIRWLGKQAGRPIEIASQMLADQLYAWQWQNRVRILERVMKIRSARPAAQVVMSPDFLLAAVDAMGNTSNPDLQELWARLIANASEDEKRSCPAFIEVTKRLTRDAAIAFDLIARVSLLGEDELVDSLNGLLESEIHNEFCFSPTLALLESCNLIHYTALVTTLGGTATGDPMILGKDGREFGLTLFGVMYHSAISVSEAHSPDPELKTMAT